MKFAKLIGVHILNIDIILNTMAKMCYLKKQELVYYLKLLTDQD